LILRSSKAVLFAVIVLLSGCSGCGDPVAEVVPVSLDLPIGRLDQALFNADPDSISSVSLKAYATYGEFYRIYIK
jgi:hypothetical protein